jgi:hypothetical protein
LRIYMPELDMRNQKFVQGEKILPLRFPSVKTVSLCLSPAVVD